MFDTNEKVVMFYTFVAFVIVMICATLEAIFKCPQ